MGSIFFFYKPELTSPHTIIINANYRIQIVFLTLARKTNFKRKFIPRGCSRMQESARVSFLQNSIIILFKKKILRKSLALWIFLAKIAEKFALKAVMQIQKALLNDHLRVSKVS